MQYRRCADSHMITNAHPIYGEPAYVRVRVRVRVRIRVRIKVRVSRRTQAERRSTSEVTTWLG